MTREQQDRLAAEHVLGLLEGEEQTLAERLLASDRAFRDSVDRWRSHFAEFDETAPAVATSAHLWQRIETSLVTEPAPARPSPAASAPAGNVFGDLWASLAFWRATGMAAAFASLLLALGVGYFADKASRQPVMIAVLVNDANQPGAILSAFADGRAELVPLGGTSIPHNHSMQVWTFPDPKGAPVSVGLIHDARTVRLNLAAVPRLHAEQLFAISMEPLHGSPTGLPTGPVVLKGTASTAL